MKILVSVLFLISFIISILFACFVFYGVLESSLQDSETALPLISIWAYRISELLIDFYKSFFYIQLLVTGSLAYLFFSKKLK